MTTVGYRPQRLRPRPAVASSRVLAVADGGQGRAVADTPQTPHHGQPFSPKPRIPEVVAGSPPSPSTSQREQFQCLLPVIAQGGARPGPGRRAQVGQAFSSVDHCLPGIAAREEGRSFTQGWSQQRPTGAGDQNVLERARMERGSYQSPPPSQPQFPICQMKTSMPGLCGG